MQGMLSLPMWFPPPPLFDSLALPRRNHRNGIPSYFPVINAIPLGIGLATRIDASSVFTLYIPAKSGDLCRPHFLPLHP
eukprot:scaffold248293_cov15-Tisochrysis_lutea.AAC.1